MNEPILYETKKHYIIKNKKTGFYEIYRNELCSATRCWVGTTKEPLGLTIAKLEILNLERGEQQ